ncbi:MAG TPA: DUF3224 domain-containing protein [Candidatus Acidoferrum sp.]|nr:DUF3224 domain-containing protein [Candidatus Acidoferrum sp.]
MNKKFRAALLLLLPICVIAPSAAQKEAPMPHHATGTFEVKLTPLDPAFKSDDNSIGRYSIDKQFHGALEATSKGEMLSGMGTVKGSGGYVAIERVTGTLDGRTGTFILQHNGTMQAGVFHLNVVVVPDSGTAQLTGLQGSMEIIIKDGKHSYDLTYTLPAPN